MIKKENTNNRFSKENLFSVPDWKHTFLHKYDVESIISNSPHTIVNWKDGTKTVVACRKDEVYSLYTGFYACLAKKVYGGHGKYKKYIENAILTPKKISNIII